MGSEVWGHGAEEESPRVHILAGVHIPGETGGDPVSEYVLVP